MKKLLSLAAILNKRSALKQLFFLSLILLSISQLRAQTTATFTPSGDAFVLSEVSPSPGYTVNYGTDPRLFAMAWTNGGAYNYRSFIEFNTASIPSTANVCSAYLTFYTTAENNQAGSNQPNSFYLKRVTGASWTNSGITWSNQPALSTTDIISCPSFTAATGSSYTINVTSHVQSMVSSPSTNYGWCIMLQTEGSPYASLAFASSDNSSSSLHPVLTVVYSPTISGTTPGSHCGTGTVSLGATATSGTVSWYTAATGGSAVATGTTYTTPSLSTTTTYYVDATAGGCTTASRTAVVATINSAPAIVASPTSPAVCAGGTVAVTASGASTYTWSPATDLNTTTGPSVVVDPTVTTTYTISGTSAAGCTGTKTVSITVNALPTVSISPTSPSTCNGATVTITASGASTYTWSPPTFLNTTSGANVTATPTAAINYTVSGTNANGCVNTTSVAVTVNALPTIGISPASATICVGNSTSLTAGGASTYTWSNGANTASVSLSPTVTTTYTVSGTNGTGCVGTKTIVVTVNPLPTLTISPASPAICIGSSTGLTASGASTYTWSPATGLNNTSGSTVTANPTATILYTIAGTNANNCVGTQTVNLTVNALPVITTNPAAPVVLGGQGATITASGAATYTWSPATNLNTTTGATVTAIPQITKGYTVTGTDAHGCVNNAALSVAVELWQQTADTFHAPIFYSGNLGIGNSNPQAPLDVTGNAKIAGVLTASTLSVTGGASFDSLDAGKRLSLGGGQSGLGFAQHTTGLPNIIYTGNQTPPSTLSSAYCNSVIPIDWSDPNAQLLLHHGSISSFAGTATGSIAGGNLNISLGLITMGYDGVHGIIESGGFNLDGSAVSMLLNWQCGNDVGICNNPGSAGGTNQHGGIVSMGQNVEIGNPGRDLNTALNITANGSTALKIQDANNHPILNVASNGNVSIPGGAQIILKDNDHGLGYYDGNTGAGHTIPGFANTIIDGPVLYGYGGGALGYADNYATTPKQYISLQWDNTGKVMLPGYKLTSSGTTSRTLVIDQNGLISAGAGAGSAGSAWVLGGNANTGSNNILGTNDGTDLILSAGGTGTVGTPRMILKNATGYVGIGDQFVGSSPNNVASLLDVGINTNNTSPSPFAIRDFKFSPTLNAWNYTLFEVEKNGGTFIGLTRPRSNVNYYGGSVLLTVAGTIITKEIYVQNSDWADYVFKKDYKLMPLAEVERYISLNQHLPNIQSAAEIEMQGQEIGKLQTKQMEKIEELTLYLIELNKKLERVEEQNKKLATELAELKNK